MRYATVILYQDEESFHPIAHELAREPSIRRKAIHSIKLLEDGTLALLGEIEGDLDRYREIMEDSPAVHTYAVSGDQSGYTYSQVDSTEQTRRMLELRDQGQFIIQMPIEYTEDGGKRFTVVGEEESLLTLSELFDVENAEVELVSTGPYFPEDGGVFADLTDRQREVLETAVRMGYYRSPREATLEDIAAELDVDHGTVGRHIRTIESKVFAKFLRY